MANKPRRRTAEEIRMARAEHDRDIEEIIQERDDLQHKFDSAIEQNRQALEEFDRLYREEITKLRVEVGRLEGENETLRRHLTVTQQDHRVCSTYAAGVDSGLDNVEHATTHLLEVVRALRLKAQHAAQDAIEDEQREHEEQARLPAPAGAPGTRPAPDDDRPPPKFLTSNQEDER